MIVDLLSHTIAVLAGAGIYHQWLKRSPETLQEMLDKLRALDKKRREG